MNNAVKNMKDNQPTCYYPAGDSVILPGQIELPGLLQRKGFPPSNETLSLLAFFYTPDQIRGLMAQQENKDEVQCTYQLSAITADFIYYVDEENGDDPHRTVMLNREMKLVSDGRLAQGNLSEQVALNQGFLWMSAAAMYWQRAQFIQPELMTAEIIAALEAINIRLLTDEEQLVYYAFLNNGPVKYTKAESLMAVISNEFDEAYTSGHLATIQGMLGNEER